MLIGCSHHPWHRLREAVDQPTHNGDKISAVRVPPSNPKPGSSPRGLCHWIGVLFYFLVARFVNHSFHSLSFFVILGNFTSRAFFVLAKQRSRSWRVWIKRYMSTIPLYPNKEISSTDFVPLQPGMNNVEAGLHWCVYRSPYPWKSVSQTGRSVTADASQCSIILCVTYRYCSSNPIVL